MATVEIDPKTIKEMFDTASLGAPENAVGFVLWRIVARYQREVDRALAPLNLTNLQFVILALVAWLEQSGEQATQIELSRFGGIHRMQVSQILKVLEKKKFIARERSTSDSRAKRVKLTRRGLNVLRQAFPAVIEVQSRLFGEMGRPAGSFLTVLLRLDREQVAKIGEE
jgi:DNA-binding MarR family transcriptional regulator